MKMERNILGKNLVSMEALQSRNENLESYQPLISIVITTHNRREKVLRAIKSVLASIYLEDKLEIIIVDDASTDGTSRSIRSTFSKDSLRLLEFKREQLVSECRNIGLKEAKGEYIFFLDDDVIVAPRTISKLVKFLLQNENVACAIPLILYYNKPNVIWCAGIKHNFWTTLGKLIGHNKLNNGQFGHHPICSDSVFTAFMVRKSIANELKFDSENFPIGWEDMDFAVKIKRKAKHDVVVLPWVTVWHDYSGAHFLKNKLRLYFEVRNRVLFHRRWSTNSLQYFFSTSFSVTIGLSYILFSLTFKRDYVNRVRVVFKALLDALRMEEINLKI